MGRFMNARAFAKMAGYLFIYTASIAALSAQSMMRASPKAAAGGGNQATVAGRIERIVGAAVFVAAADGSVTSVEVGSGTLVLGRRAASLDSIKAGEALGVAATRAEDGSLTATAINVFPPELWQRARKGQFPMADGQVMTNAQMERLGTGLRGRTLYLKYEMLTAAIAVPEGADIRRSSALRLSDLKEGEKVTIRGSTGPGGSLAASTISVDLPG
jgi:hypothetical protein